jgi:parallel beta-helix repeat protein
MSLSGFQNGTVSDCQVNGNANNTGIYLAGSSCFILGNSCSGNGISIFVQGANNQIDGNHVIGSNPSAIGIWINNAAGITNNIVIRNFVTGYGANDYSLGTGQIAGPIINSVVSEIITNSNPWANFAF